ncbi:MAG: hypothetical protein WB615_05795 [Candidatus Tumulicola sp.]
MAFYKSRIPTAGTIARTMAFSFGHFCTPSPVPAATFAIRKKNDERYECRQVYHTLPFYAVRLHAAARHSREYVRQWRDKYAGFEAGDLTRLKQLEVETHARIAAIARLTMEVDAVRELTTRTAGADVARYSCIIKGFYLILFSGLRGRAYFQPFNGWPI